MGGKELLSIISNEHGKLVQVEVDGVVDKDCQMALGCFCRRDGRHFL